MVDPHTAESAHTEREHYLFVNMRDVGCNCGVRYDHDPMNGRAALDALHAAHMADVSTPPGQGHGAPH